MVVEADLCVALLLLLREAAAAAAADVGSARAVVVVGDDDAVMRAQALRPLCSPERVCVGNGAFLP